jgi:hypothetical protein
VLPEVGAVRLLDGLRVQRAASDSNGRGVGALSAGGDRWVALDVDVDCIW